MNIMSLPLVMIENILTYLSYDEIAKTRLVSKSLNLICSRMLNRGFSLIERRHSIALKNVKTQLPRRESERRYHQLSRHCDILTSIETRISMLNMTYSKFIDHKMCCFIPGKVIDEIRRVLTLVETVSSPPRAHEVLQELRDISSMAIEHFDDKISPAFRKQLQDGATPPTRASQYGWEYMEKQRREWRKYIHKAVRNNEDHLDSKYLVNPSTPNDSTDGWYLEQQKRDWRNFVYKTVIKHEERHLKEEGLEAKRLLRKNQLDLDNDSPAVIGPMAMCQDLKKLQRRTMLNSKLTLQMASQYKTMSKRIIDHKKVILRQQRLVKRMVDRQKEQDAVIADLKKRIDECDIKYSELTHTNVGGKTLAGTSEVSSSSQPLRHFSSQIKLDLSVLPIGTSKCSTSTILPNMKPRTPVIRLPSLSEVDGELPQSEAKKPKKDEIKKRGRDNENQKTRTSTNEDKKIRSVTNEIRKLNNMTFGVKRSMTDKEKGTKKLKID